MSDYQNKEDVFSYLQSLNIGILSTVSEQGKPHGAVIYFVIDHNFNFFFVTKSDTKKAQHLEKNNNASLTIIDPHEPKTIQTSGTVSKVEEPDLYTYILKKMSDTISTKGIAYWPPPISKINSAGNLVVYRFHPDWLRIGDFTQAKNSERVFREVIPENYEQR